MNFLRTAFVYFDRSRKNDLRPMMDFTFVLDTIYRKNFSKNSSHSCWTIFFFFLRSNPRTRLSLIQVLRLDIEIVVRLSSPPPSISTRAIQIRLRTYRIVLKRKQWYRIFSNEIIIFGRMIKSSAQEFSCKII